jgi:hypothetical protein
MIHLHWHIVAKLLLAVQPPTPIRRAYFDVAGNLRTWKLDSGTLAFSLFQIPVCYPLSHRPCIHLKLRDGSSIMIDGNTLPQK